MVMGALILGQVDLLEGDLALAKLAGLAVGAIVSVEPLSGPEGAKERRKPAT